jgi:hypothetical protein
MRTIREVVASTEEAKNRLDELLAAHSDKLTHADKKAVEDMRRDIDRHVEVEARRANTSESDEQKGPLSTEAELESYNFSSEQGDLLSRMQRTSEELAKTGERKYVFGGELVHPSLYLGIVQTLANQETIDQPSKKLLRSIEGQLKKERTLSARQTQVIDNINEQHINRVVFLAEIEEGTAVCLIPKHPFSQTHRQYVERIVTLEYTGKMNQSPIKPKQLFDMKEKYTGHDGRVDLSPLRAEVERRVRKQSLLSYKEAITHLEGYLKALDPAIHQDAGPMYALARESNVSHQGLLFP